MVVIDVSKVWPPTLRLTRSPIILQRSASAFRVLLRQPPTGRSARSTVEMSQMCAIGFRYGFQRNGQSKRQVVRAATH